MALAGEMSDVCDMGLSGGEFVQQSSSLEGVS
jgi:hypothetical protein